MIPHSPPARGRGSSALPQIICADADSASLARHQAQLAELLSHVGTAIDRYRAGETDLYAMDETIHHCHRAAAELWKFCFARGGGTRGFIAELLDRMTADAEAINWWDRATPRRH